MRNSERPRFAFPPGLILLVAASGWGLALAVWLIQPRFDAVGWAGVGAGVLGLLAWGLLAPEQVSDLVRGRWVQYGGVAALVLTAIVLASAFLYVAVRQQGWRADFSAGELYSLAPATRALVTRLALDPTTPDLRVIGFIGTAQAGQRDRIAVLLEDVARTSQGRITYEFIDPDRDPLRTQALSGQAGQFLVAPLGPQGPEYERAQRLEIFNQQTLADALVSLSARGDYRAYFLAVGDSLRPDDLTPVGAAILAEQLRQRFNWQVGIISLFDLASDLEGQAGRLLDPTADGEVLIIAGGSQALTEEQQQPILDYVERGGNLMILAGVNLQGQPALATAPDFNRFLAARFGLRINDDIVIDPFNSVQAPVVLRTTTYGDHPIVAQYGPTDALIFEAPHSLTLADPAPPNAVVTPIVLTSRESYAKTGIDYSRELTDFDFALTADDQVGQFVLMALAENRALGSRLVVATSESLIYNAYQSSQVAGVRNLLVLRDSLFWAVDYASAILSLPVAGVDQRPESAPILATDQQLRGLNFVAVFVLPVGVLLVGGLVWWGQRERAREEEYPIESVT